MKTDDGWKAALYDLRFGLCPAMSKINRWKGFFYRGNRTRKTRLPCLMSLIFLLQGIQPGVNAGIHGLAGGALSFQP